jgi:hypothetical protein
VFSFEVIPAYSIPRPKSTLALVKGCCEIGFFSFSLLFVLLLLLVLLLEMASVRAAKTLASRRLINNSEVFEKKVGFNNCALASSPVAFCAKMEATRVAQFLIAICLAALAGCSQSETMVGRSGPLKAFRTQAFLGWEIRIKNDSDVKYPALYDINGDANLMQVPAHGNIKAGYVLGREIPSFSFADPPLRRSD